MYFNPKKLLDGFMYIRISVLTDSCIISLLYRDLLVELK